MSGSCHTQIVLLATILFAVHAGPKSTFADDWPEWLGAKRDGVWRESGILEAFPKDGPPLRWKTKIGGGYSGPAVAKGRVFVMDRVAEPSEKPKLLHKGRAPSNRNFVRKLLPGKERLLCLREADGKLLWKHEYDCPYTTVALYAIGPRATPTVDGELVFTLGAEGNLNCLRVSDGFVVWSIDFKKKYGLKIPNWGTASPPLVDGDRLLCIVGGKNSTCVAYDKRTGKELWRALSAKESGYSSPVIYKVAGKRQLIIWDSDAVNSLDPETGKVIWSVPFPSTFAMSVATPRLEKRSLFVMCFARKSAMIQIAEDGLSAKLAWRGGVKKGIGGVHNTAFLHDGHIFACGSGGRYICARLDTGERVWSTFEPSSSKRPIAWGNVFTVRHQDRYFLANDLGDLIIARMSPTGNQELSRANLIRPTHKVAGRTLVWSHPAFANRSVYLRNDEEIRCYSLAE